MLKLKRILHPSDFSRTAHTTMRYSVRLAYQLGIPLDVLHVIPGIGKATFEVMGLDLEEQNLDESHRKALSGFRELAKLNAPEHVPIRFLLGKGTLPGPVILEQAALVDSNLIVLGTHGQRAGGKVLGSVATELMQRSVCPLFMVPARMAEMPEQPIKRMLVVVSYAHLLKPVMDFSERLAELFEARLEVLKAQNGGSLDTEAITAYAKDHEAQLMIMDAPGLVGVGAPLEDRTERLVSDAPCPVALVNTCGKVFQDSRQHARNRQFVQPA